MIMSHHYQFWLKGYWYHLNSLLYWILSPDSKNVISFPFQAREMVKILKYPYFPFHRERWSWATPINFDWRCIAITSMDFYSEFHLQILKSSSVLTSRQGKWSNFLEAILSVILSKTGRDQEVWENQLMERGEGRDDRRWYTSNGLA